MLRNVSIKVQLIIYVSLLLSTVILLVSISSYYTSREELRKEIHQKFEIITNLKVQNINNSFELLKSGISFIKKSKLLQHTIPFYLEHYKTVDDSVKRIADGRYGVIADEFESTINAFDISSISLLTPSGEAIYPRSLSQIQLRISKKAFIAHMKDAKDTLSFSDVFEIPTKSQVGRQPYGMYIFAPYKSADRLLGILVCEVNLDHLFEDVQDSTGLGRSGETLLGKKMGKNAVFLNPLRHDPSAALKRKVPLTSKSAIPVIEACQGIDGSGISVDYRKQEVYAMWRFIPEVGWGIVTKIDKDEAFQSVNYLKGLVMLIAVILIVLIVLISVIFVDRFIKPIYLIRDNMISLANGQFPKKIKYNKKDEIGETVEALNSHIGSLRYSTDFAKDIGAGNFDSDIDEGMKKDVLSASLISMRDSLKKASIENDRREWANSGSVKHVEILRNFVNDIDKMCNEFIESLVPYVGGNFGGVFTFETDEPKPYLKLRGTYAYPVSSKDVKIELGQTLVGQAALDKEYKILEDLPKEYPNVSSGLGEAKPVNVIVMPCILNDEIFGVIEIGGFSKFEKYQIDLMNALAESMASSILSYRSTHS